MGEICLTSNDKKMRAEKMKTGRVACLVKLFPGHKENSNTRLELRSLAALNEAMQDEKKVNLDPYLNYIITSFTAHRFPHSTVCTVV